MPEQFGQPYYLHATRTNLGPIRQDVNAAWDLATAIKFLEHDLGYKGLYTIEASNGHEGTQPIYEVIVATV